MVLIYSYLMLNEINKFFLIFLSNYFTKNIPKNTAKKPTTKLAIE